MLAYQVEMVGVRAWARHLGSLHMLLHIVESWLSRVEARPGDSVGVAWVFARSHLTVVHLLSVAVIEQISTIG